jgi:hypothetical protein
MLTDKELKNLRKELDECKRPLFIFDDDPDGLASFLLFYKYKKEGKGIAVKTQPKITKSNFSHLVESYDPDKVFILDVPVVEQDFIDDIKVPIIWVDHHDPLKRENIKYINPRINDPGANYPTSLICYNTVKGDLWIAMVGIVGDWTLPKDLALKFNKKYPKLLPKKADKPEKALFDTELGKLIKIISFALKGGTNDVVKCIKVMTRINDPYEILEQKTAQGKFIYKKYDKINKNYEDLLKDAIKGKDKSKLLKFIYPGDKMSFTKDLSNELLFRYPKKIILIAREKDGEFKCSLRSSGITIKDIVKKALIGLNGYGGGHEHACGSCLRTKEDFDEFVKRIKEEI